MVWKLAYGRIEENWSDEPVYLVGGGTSLNGIDLSGLMDLGFVVGINRSAFVTPCHALFSMDQHFVRMMRNEIVAFAESGGRVFLAMPANEDGHEQIPGAVYVLRDRHQGLSTRPNAIYGGNSGFGGLNLAYLANAKEIALLGYDMVNGKEQTHWHGGYRWHNSRNHKFYDRWASNFDMAADQLSEAGAHCTNFVGEPRSIITSFPTRSLDDLF